MGPTTRLITTWAACVGAGLVFALPMTAGATSAAAQEACWTGRHGQFFNAIQYCVSSVLAPQAGNTYGPENLASNAGAAWCEGASRHGIGESIMIRIEGGPAFRRLLVGNGYGKSSQTYASNGRVKTVEITADTGFTTIVNLADRSDLATVNLPALARDWIRVKIVEVYPGKRVRRHLPVLPHARLRVRRGTAAERAGIAAETAVTIGISTGCSRVDIHALGVELALTVRTKNHEDG